MKVINCLPGIILIFSLSSCYEIYDKRHPKQVEISADSSKVINIKDTTAAAKVVVDTPAFHLSDTLPNMIHTGNLPADSVIAYAKTLIGTPYRYASTDPSVGFDCSGFFTYIFTHFNIKVPRASREFEFSGINTPLPQAHKGDLILFTGTDSTERFIGHMGLIINNDHGNIEFIHSSSGKAHGVTISPLDKYYMGRFLKVIRIFSR